MTPSVVIARADMCFGPMQCRACRHRQYVYWSPASVGAMEYFACVKCGAQALEMTGAATIADARSEPMAADGWCRDLIYDCESPQRES